MNKLIVTVDLDWACEPAIVETLDYLQELKIKPTVFITHISSRIEESMNDIEIGVHPYFGADSCHGSTISEVVNHIMDLPHNLPAFRCHRFAICNSSKQAMADAGMIISSNVCTDLEIVSPFKDRFGFLEVPIYLEDGGYLWRGHSLEISPEFKNTIIGPGIKTIIIYPMHFALNTPNFSYMSNIKRSLSRNEWKNMTKTTMNKLSWKGRGIRNLIVELLQLTSSSASLGSLIQTS